MLDIRALELATMINLGTPTTLCGWANFKPVAHPSIGWTASGEFNDNSMKLSKSPNPKPHCQPPGCSIGGQLALVGRFAFGLSVSRSEAGADVVISG